MSHDIQLDGVGVRFGSFTAVRDVTLTIRVGEFFSILGPSGCGKTTLLRLVSGFLPLSQGSLHIGGRDMRGVSANARPTAMIFQTLALFPFLSVRDNVAFGLEARGVSKSERHRRAEACLAFVALPGTGDRRIMHLSGGQRQRVAIARALAIEPQVLLLDEPLSALDLKLRQHMRAELRAIQRRAGITFVYITHDQSEALAMSDRVAVMSQGVIHQVGTPMEIYERPATSFVASFVGEANMIPGTIAGVADGFATIETGLGRLDANNPRGLAPGASAILQVRPERLTFAEARNAISLRLERLDYEGGVVALHFRDSGNASIVMHCFSGAEAHIPAAGETARAGFAPSDALILPAGDCL